MLNTDEYFTYQVTKSLTILPEPSVGQSTACTGLACIDSAMQLGDKLSDHLSEPYVQQKQVAESLPVLVQ